MSKTAYDSKSQQRVLSIVALLAGNEFHGLLPSEIAKAIHATPSMITRDLHNIREAGFAEQVPETGRWRLGPKLVQIALAFSTSLSRAQARVGEIQNRYTREI